jgi:hypothetical protein
VSFFLAALTRGNNAETQTREMGQFETQEEAVAASKKMIDASLLREFKAGMSAQQLLLWYQSFGEVPFIFGDPGHTMSVKGFNHLQYAKERCVEICSGK